MLFLGACLQAYVRCTILSGSSKDGYSLFSLEKQFYFIQEFSKFLYVVYLQ